MIHPYLVHFYLNSSEWRMKSRYTLMILRMYVTYFKNEEASMNFYAVEIVSFYSQGQSKIFVEFRETP